MYNFLFYKSFQLSGKLKHWKDTPVSFSILTLLVSIAMNISMVYFFIIGSIENIALKEKLLSYTSEFSIVKIIIIYIAIYLYFNKKRRIRIINHYDEKPFLASLNPVLVLVVYYFLSGGLVILSGMYMHKDWIFS